MKKRLAKKIMNHAHSLRYSRELVLDATNRVWKHYTHRKGGVATLPIRLVVDLQQIRDDVIFHRHEWRRTLQEPCLSHTGEHGPFSPVCDWCETCGAST
jgi:hypothetical protein